MPRGIERGRSGGYRPGASPPVRIVVSGASSGIGEATALRLRRSGRRVLGGVRREEDAERLRAAGIEPLLLDVTDPAHVAAAAEAIGDAPLHGLVNNAGVAVAAPLELLPLDELRRQLEVNLVGQVAVTQALLPALRRGRGRVVMVSSVAGRSSLPLIGAYGASKHALEGVVDALRLELRPFGIEVVSIQPASIATPMWTRGAAAAAALVERAPPELAQLYASRIAALRRIALERGAGGEPPETVAAAIERALTARRPRARVLVGRDARLRATLELLPVRLRDRALERILFRGA
jgi:NAD(P)-dependent dehydrogenase (short-subunit alcohol dehydrogenase family)